MVFMMRLTLILHKEVEHRSYNLGSVFSGPLGQHNAGPVTTVRPDLERAGRMGQYREIGGNTVPP